MPATPTEKKVRILCIEDDQQMRTFLVNQLRVRNYDIQAVRDGAQALDKAVAFQPQIILLDLSLPDADVGEPAGRFQGNAERVRRLCASLAATEPSGSMSPGWADSGSDTTTSGGPGSATPATRRPSPWRELAPPPLVAVQRRAIDAGGHDLSERQPPPRENQRTAGERGVLPGRRRPRDEQPDVRARRHAGESRDSARARSPSAVPYTHLTRPTTYTV